MKHLFSLLLLGVLCSNGMVDSARCAEPVAGPIHPVNFEKVQLTDRFWLPRQQQQHDVTIPYALDNAANSVENLRRTAHYLQGIPDKMPISPQFLSSDLFKVMESAAYSLTITPDAALEARIDSLVELIASAQQPDGYLFELHTCHVPYAQEIGTRPYSQLSTSHELYNMGHMYEGAVAYYRATGKDRWLKLAEKSAHHINHVFFEGDPAYNDGKPVMEAPGHQEIELALCQLYQVTGDTLYLGMAHRFLDLRGVNYHGVADPIDLQAYAPVCQQFTPEGHAVRATYMYTGMADVDALSGTHRYRTALDSIWKCMVGRRMHITGGIGTIHRYEGFGADYVLPNKTTYNETCAAVGNVFFNDRMFRLTGEARYLDVLECALFNGALAGINLAGNRFFYPNVLEADGFKPFNHGLKGRAPWFGCACCPPNISRLLMKMAGYMYASTPHSIYFNLYGSSRTRISLKGGEMEVTQQSNYPFSGEVQVQLQMSRPQKAALRFRIPTWVGDQEFLPEGLYRYTQPVEEKWVLQVNGEPVEARMEQGFAVVERKWHSGDQLSLHLPMSVRYVEARAEVEADRDRFALVRGPLVYCMEEADNGLVQRYFVPEANTPVVDTFTDGVLRGIVSCTIMGRDFETNEPKSLRFIPYYAWDNRGDASMIVWVPKTASLACDALPQSYKNAQWLESLSASYNNTPDHLTALYDEVTPVKSHHMGRPMWNNRGHEGHSEWIEYRFKEKKALSSFSLFWTDDDRTTTKVPAEWHLEYLTDRGEWLPMKRYMTDSYGVQLDQFNVVHPASRLECFGIRLVMTPQPGKSVGVYEIQIAFE